MPIFQSAMFEYAGESSYHDLKYIRLNNTPNHVALHEFLHTVKLGHTVFAYVIEGKGCFDQGRDPYAYEMEGANYFDFERNCLIGPESLVMFDDGDQLMSMTADEAARFLLVSEKESP